MSDRLFELDEVPEVPIFREPRGRRGAAVGSSLDARFLNDYPPEWRKCQACNGTGRVWSSGYVGENSDYPELMHRACRDCLGMGSLRARVRLEAGHRCLRCRHPFVPKNDAKFLGVDSTPGHWSPCDEQCTHGGPVMIVTPEVDLVCLGDRRTLSIVLEDEPVVEDLLAEWRVLTVHHLDGDKANCRWWNLATLCQRCHLQIQAKVVMERVYIHEHSEWFKPFAAGYYAFVYLGEDLSRPEVEARMDELLGLELAAA